MEYSTKPKLKQYKHYLHLFENLNSIAFSSVFIFFEAFRLTLVKKNRQNEESRENVALFILTILLDKCQTKSFEEYEHTTESNTQVLYHQPTFKQHLHNQKTSPSMHNSICTSFIFLAILHVLCIVNSVNL